MAENFYDNNWDEHYIKKGNPAAPTYYIIRRFDRNVGLFSNYIVFAGHIKYALSQGYIPVIDMQNYPNTLLEPALLGKKNSWEYYFKQPFNIGLEQAYNGENVILSPEKPKTPIASEGFSAYFNNKNGQLDEWRMLVKRGFLKVQPHIQQEIDDTYNKLFSPNDRVLGVLLRGTDYVEIKPFKHPIPPPIEYALTQIILKLREWNCNKIFLATEDLKIVQACKNILGEICYTLPDKTYFNYDGKTLITLYHADRENDYYLLGKEYLIQMGILAKCNSLVAARTCGAIGVVMMADKLEHIYTFNLGQYNFINLKEFEDD